MKCIYLLLIIVIVLMLNNKINEHFMNCPQMYEKVNNKIQEKHMPSLRGYAENEYLYLIDYYDSKEPLPVNAGFFDKM